MYCHIYRSVFSSSIIFEPYFQGLRNSKFFALFLISFCHDLPHDSKLVTASNSFYFKDCQKGWLRKFKQYYLNFLRADIQKCSLEDSLYLSDLWFRITLENHHLRSPICMYGQLIHLINFAWSPLSWVVLVWQCWIGPDQVSKECNPFISFDIWFGNDTHR